MAYTGSQAQTALGALLQVNTGTASSPTFTTVGEMMDAAPNGYENKVVEVTNLQSTAVERMSPIPDGGTWPFSGNRVSTDTGQLKMAALFASGALGQFKVTLPKETGQTTSGDSWAFSGIVTKWSPAIKAGDVVKVAGEVATSNGVVFTEGA